MVGTIFSSTPAKVRIVGGLSLLWNAFGCFDYTMTQLDPAGYLGARGLGPDSLRYLANLPPLLTGLWALAVWGSLGGSLLLLARSRHAVSAFALSLVALVFCQGLRWIGGVPAELDQPAAWMMTAVIWFVLIAVLLYARAMALRGVLR